jgi:hypothetical protein
VESHGVPADAANSHAHRFVILDRADASAQAVDLARLLAG